MFWKRKEIQNWQEDAAPYVFVSTIIKIFYEFLRRSFQLMRLC